MAGNMFSSYTSTSPMTSSSSSLSVSGPPGSKLFDGLGFLVLNQDSDEVEDKMKKFGGSVEDRYYVTRVNRIIADEFNPVEGRIKKARSKDIPILKSSWIDECITQNKIVDVTAATNPDFRGKEVHPAKKARINNPEKDPVVPDTGRIAGEASNRGDSTIQLVNGKSSFV